MTHLRRGCRHKLILIIASSENGFAHKAAFEFIPRGRISKKGLPYTGPPLPSYTVGSERLKEKLTNDVQIIIDGEPRRASSDIDAFTLYRMAGYPAVLVRLVDGQAQYLRCTRCDGPFRVPVTSLPGRRHHGMSSRRPHSA